MNQEIIEFVYDAIQGEYMERTPATIKDEFVKGAVCSQLYTQVYKAERRLEARLGVEPNDDDVECIICAMSDMQKYLCFKMYEYGAKFGYDWDKICPKP